MISARKLVQAAAAGGHRSTSVRNNVSTATTRCNTQHTSFIRESRTKHDFHLSSNKLLPSNTNASPELGSEVLSPTAALLRDLALSHNTVQKLCAEPAAVQPWSRKMARFSYAAAARLHGCVRTATTFSGPTATLCE